MMNDVDCRQHKGSAMAGFVSPPVNKQPLLVYEQQRAVKQRALLGDGKLFIDIYPVKYQDEKNYSNKTVSVIRVVGTSLFYIKHTRRYHRRQWQLAAKVRK